MANIGPNSAMSPKIINGSYAALFENKDVVDDFHKKLNDLKNDVNTAGKKAQGYRPLLDMLSSL